MIPSRGVIQSVSSGAFRAKATGQLVSTRGYATGLARHTRASIRLPAVAGRSPLTYGPRSNAIAAGAVFVNQIPSSSRNLSLWGWGSGSKDPAPAAPAAEPVVASAPVPEPSAAVSAPAPVTPTPVPDPTTADLSAIINSDTAAVDVSSITPAIGYLKELGIEFGYGSTSIVQWIFEHVHVYGGMPWWGTILATSVLFRLVLWKPFLMGQETSTKLQILKREVPEYEKANEQMKVAAVAQDQAGVQAARHVVAAIEKEHGVKKWKAFISFIQIPIGIGMYRILRTAADIPVPGLEDGGVLWFTNLAVPDPWYILPAVGPLAMMATMKVTSRYSTPAQKTALKAMVVIGVPVMFFFTASFPAAVQFYFMTASIPALFQTWLVYQPWFRSVLDLPPIPKPETVEPAKPGAGGVGGAISSMKQSYSQVTEMAAKKQRESNLKKSNRQQLDDEIKLTEQYYESLRERMAEMEKSQRMKRRP